MKLPFHPFVSYLVFNDVVSHQHRIHLPSASPSPHVMVIYGNAERDSVVVYGRYWYDLYSRFACHQFFEEAETINSGSSSGRVVCISRT